MKRLCRYCKLMQGYGNEGSSRCIKGLCKGDKTAKKCSFFEDVRVKVDKNGHRAIGLGWTA